MDSADIIRTRVDEMTKWAESTERLDENSIKSFASLINTKFYDAIKLKSGLVKCNNKGLDDETTILIKRIKTLRDVSTNVLPFTAIAENLEKSKNEILEKHNAIVNNNKNNNDNNKENEKNKNNKPKMEACKYGRECVSTDMKHYYDYVHFDHPKANSYVTQYKIYLNGIEKKEKMKQFMEKHNLKTYKDVNLDDENENDNKECSVDIAKIEQKKEELTLLGLTQEEIDEEIEQMFEPKKSKKLTRSARFARRARFKEACNEDDSDDDDDNRDNESDSDKDGNDKKDNSSDEDFDVNDLSMKRRYYRKKQQQKWDKGEQSESEDEMTEEARKERLDSLLKKTDTYMRTITMRIRKNYKNNENNNNNSNNNNNGNNKSHGNDTVSTAEVRAFLQGNNDDEEQAIEQTESLVGGTLKDYQKIGLRWMVSLNHLRLNGILADEMGLGKTVQVISLFAYLLDMENNHGPHIVVAPLSTMKSWQEHFEQWCPKLKIHVHQGTKDERLEKMEKIIENIEDENDDIVNVIITTYDMAIKDGEEYLSKIRWNYLIIDEAHRIKNRQSCLFNVLNKFSTKYRLLLTGTPLQNDLKELWSLLNFILPEVFHSVQSFENWFCMPFSINKKNKDKNKNDKNFKLTDEEKAMVCERLHRAVDPFLLRRNKADVLPNLAKKKEIVLHVPMSGMQMAIYQQLVKHGGLHFNKKYNSNDGSDSDNDNDEDNEDGSEENDETDDTQDKAKTKTKTKSRAKSKDQTKTKTKGKEEKGKSKKENENEDIMNIDEKSFRYRKFNNVLMCLRQTSSHPLIIPMEHSHVEFELNFENLVEISGKVWFLDHLIPKMLAFNHRILIFCQFQATLNILEAYLDLRSVKYLRIDGSTKSEDRIAALNRFRSSTSSKTNLNSKENSNDNHNDNHNDNSNDNSNDDNNEDDEIPIFLLSTRACGVGINLQDADTVILYDSDWNPQVDVQAQARAHRVGQTRDVHVFRLISEQSIEQMMFGRAQKKLDLEKQAIEGGKFDFSLNANERKKFLQEIIKQRIKCNENYFTIAKGKKNIEKMNKLISRSKEEEKVFNIMDDMNSKKELKRDNIELPWLFGDLQSKYELPPWLHDIDDTLKREKEYKESLMKSGKRRRTRNNGKNKGKNDETETETEKLFEQLDKDIEFEDKKNKREKNKRRRQATKGKGKGKGNGKSKSQSSSVKSGKSKSKSQSKMSEDNSEDDNNKSGNENDDDNMDNSVSTETSKTNDNDNGSKKRQSRKRKNRDFDKQDENVENENSDNNSNSGNLSDKDGNKQDNGSGNDNNNNNNEQEAVAQRPKKRRRINKRK